MILQNIDASASPEVQMNENFESIEAIAVYGKRQPVTTGLTWGYYGGLWGGLSVTAGTLTLTDNATNYVSVAVANGVITSSTSTTNWNDTANYLRVYKLTTIGGVVAVADDYRAGPDGVHGTGTPGMSVTIDTDGTLAANSDGVVASQKATKTYVDANRRTVSVVTPSSGIANIDCSLGDYFTLAPTANVTGITFSNLPGSGRGTSLMVRFTQDTTARTVTWPSSFRWDGSAPSVSTGSGAIDVLAITTFDNGTKWDATLSKARV